MTKKKAEEIKEPKLVGHSGLPHIPVEFKIANKVLAVSLKEAKLIQKQLNETIKMIETI